MKIKATLSIGFCQAIRKTEIEINDEELEGMTEDEKNEYIQETVNAWADNYIEINWNENN